MEIIPLKSNARKTLTKQTRLYINRDSLELILEHCLYIFLRLYGVLAILFFKFTVKLIKPR